MMTRSKREERPLLLQEAPILSDQMPGSPIASSEQEPKTKKSLIKRLFQKKRKTKDSSSPSNSYEGPKGGILSHLSSSTSTRSPSKAPAIPLSSSQIKPDDCTESTNNSSNPVEELLQAEPQLSTSPTKEDNASPASPQQQPQATPSILAGTPYSNKATPRAKGKGNKHVADVLARPFGRDSIEAKEQKWVVQVANAEWEPEESLWKYRITVQKRTEDYKLQDYTNGFTFRSLTDFHWLEQALLTEFLGGLLLPSLSISLGVPDLESCQHEVDARFLTHWLSDVLNGVRGQGELLLNLDEIDVTASESMEAFLYRTDLLAPMEMPQTPCAMQTPILESMEHATNNPNTWNNWMYPELCTGCTKPATPRTMDTLFKQRRTPRNPLTKINCTSRALGDARSFDVQDSFAEAATFETANAPLAIHSELLQAEKELVWSWRTRALQAMEKLSVLQEQEKHIGAAWKRFAISVSNLFAYEKDVESARLGDSKTRNDLQMPYRKLHKSAVDDSLRILARQKVERSSPSLDALGILLSAYVADLSAVHPSVQAYLEGLNKLAEQKRMCEALKATAISNKKVTPTAAASSSSLAHQIQAGIQEVKKQLVVATSQDDGQSDATRSDEKRFQFQQQQLQLMETRVLVNEAFLKDFLTTLCKTAPVRTARMAHAYFRFESKQCGLMHGAAINMKTKINVASKESLSKMIHRHHTEVKEDRPTELQLVQRIVNIVGNTKKFLKGDDDGATEEVERGVEINKDMENEEAKLRDNALELTRERIGRWNAKLAMAIMEAVGVSDANVRVEETTRDLRMVRKYAIALRENVQRCAEALEILRMSILQGRFGDIRDLRHDFMTEMHDLFSATYLPSDDAKKAPSKLALKKVGIRLNDPSGWRRNDPESCGGATKTYMDTRESGTEWLLESLGLLLKDYNQRVESVESFVYMECVGIQLEKHFSQSRATALSAFEKKTDITSAINIATRKRMPVLVKELQAKLQAVGADVSHTTVKEAKEAHLESKTLKQELHDLAMRQLTRSRETSTERVIALMTVWSNEEEGAASTEMKLLEDLQISLEMSIGKDEFAAYREASPTPR